MPPQFRDAQIFERAARLSRFANYRTDDFMRLAERDAATDQVFVANYEQGTVSVISQTPGYTATFNESGLTTGTSWS